MNKFKIALINCYSDDNRGDAGIIEATIRLLTLVTHKKGLSPEFHVVSLFDNNSLTQHNPHKLTKLHVASISPSSTPQKVIDSSSKASKFLRLIKNLISSIYVIKRINHYSSKNSCPPGISTLAESDIVISKGGSFLYDKGGLTGLFYLLRMLAPIAFSRMLGKNVIILGQSIGPFKSIYTRHLAKTILKNCTLLPREKYSQEYLNELELKGDIIPDIAFFLPKPANPIGRKNQICLTARTISSNQEQQEKYEEKIASVIKILSEFDRRLSFIFAPQVIGPTPAEDDRSVHQRIASRLDKHTLDNVQLKAEELTISQLTSLYQESQLLITTRLHASIFAATAGTPSLVLEYQQKKALGTYENIQLNEVLSHDSTTNVISKKAIKMLTEIETYRSAIEIEVPKIRHELETTISRAI